MWGVGAGFLERMGCSAVISADDLFLIMVSQIVSSITGTSGLFSCWRRSATGRQCKIKRARSLGQLLALWFRHIARGWRFLMRLRGGLRRWLRRRVCLGLRRVLGGLWCRVRRLVQLILGIRLQASATQAFPEPVNMNCWYPLFCCEFEFWRVHSRRVADDNRGLCRQLLIVRGACKPCQAISVDADLFTYPSE